jgi:hypothetical protein
MNTDVGETPVRRRVPFRRAIVTTIAVLVAALVFRNHGMQSVNWTFPYFSGAANFAKPFDWRISPTEFARVARLDPAAYMSYRHQASGDAIPNIVNNYGYVVVVRIARSFFFWMGDGNATVVFQVLCHLGIVLLVQSMLATSFQQNAFLLAYGVNPLVIRYVTFPFYYFWTVVPSVVLLAFALRRTPASVRQVLLCAVLLYLAILIRPTTLFVALLAFAVAFHYGQRKGAIAGLIVFIGLVGASGGGGGARAWHPAYVGYGAFRNPEGIELTDESAYEHYRQATGKVISTDAILGTFQNRSEVDAYQRWLKAQTLASIRNHPWAHLRNAATFTAQAFGPGFVVGHSFLSVVTAGVGLLVLALALWSHQYVLATGVLAYAASFTPYYPPVPAYLFGAYILTALIVVRGAEPLWNSIRKRSS